MSLKALQETRGEALAEIQTLRDVIANENRDFTADEEQKWDRCNADFDAASKRIDIIEQTRTREDIAAEARAESRAEEPQVDPLRAFLRQCNSSEGAGLPLFRSAPKTAEEARAMSTTVDSEGGYTIPTDLVRNIEIAMLEFGGVREVARIIRTEGGNQLDIPTVNDTGNTGSIEGENDALATTDVTFGTKALNAYKVSSDLVKIPFELFQDSAFNMGELLGQLLGERIARNAAALYTTGTGSSQPNGAVTASALGVTAAGAAAITADELIDLFHSVGRSYRRNGTFMMADATAKLIRKLKDGDSQYLWNPGIQAGQPDVLLGRPVVTNDDMPAATTGLKSVLFGDFSKFWIRDVANVRIRQLNERFADNDQIGFVALLRTDSELCGNAGINPIKHLIQA